MRLTDIEAIPHSLDGQTQSHTSLNKTDRYKATPSSQRLKDKEVMPPSLGLTDTETKPISLGLTETDQTYFTEIDEHKATPPSQGSDNDRGAVSFIGMNHYKGSIYFRQLKSPKNTSPSR